MSMFGQCVFPSCLISDVMEYDESKDKTHPMILSNLPLAILVLLAQLASPQSLIPRNVVASEFTVKAMISPTLVPFWTWNGLSHEGLSKPFPLTFKFATKLIHHNFFYMRPWPNHTLYFIVQMPCLWVWCAQAIFSDAMACIGVKQSPEGRSANTVQCFLHTHIF